MGKHKKIKDGAARHAKPREQSTVVRKAAILGAGAVAVPVTAFTFAPSAMAAETQNIPRVVVPAVAPAGGDVPATPAKCEDYTVKHGDTFSGVARSYGVSLATLKTLNPGVAKHRADFSLMFAGGHIHLPDGSCDPASPPPATPPVTTPSHYWKNCTDAKHHGWHDFRKASSGYRPALDGDHDGIACETTPTPAPTPTPVTPPPPVVGGSFVPVIAPDGPGTKSGYVAHSPSFWIPLINQAMNLVGGRVAQGNQVQAVVYRITVESSGDPNAINNYDINAQNGDPSRGLMQTIGATFNGNHLAGTSSNIYDPLANICAALKYINAQYGGIVPTGSTY